MKKLIAVLSMLFSLCSLVSVAGEPDPYFDRLDGRGPSRKRVNVIEWEGNLEIHVYPVGSLKGLALQIDESTGKKVMVIGYRFDNAPKPLIRRAILGIDLAEGFKVYRDKSAGDYDKVIISNNTLSEQVVAMKLDPPPSQLYPDDPTDAPQKQEKQQRAVASEKSVDQPKADINEDGAIRPFFMRREKN